MFLSRASTIIACCTLYALALGLRLFGLTAAGLQPDELHWQARSYQIVKNVRAEQYQHLTTHLPHPGIAAAVVMAGGQYLSERYNHSKGLSPGQPGYLDHLSACRIANAAVSSLVAPLLFLGALSIIGFWPSIIAAGLFAMDPHHIGLSRQAHIDSVQTLLITVCALLFLHSMLRNNLLMKLAAGVSWGLALSIKPTAILILPGLALGRALYYLLLRNTSSRGGRIELLSWSDIWTGMLGLGVFALLYTRLWHTVTNQGYKLNIWMGQKIWIDTWGDLLAQREMPAQLALSLLVAATLVMLAQVRHRPSGFLELTASLVSLLTIFFGLLIIAPQFLKNFAGYWMWALGLSGEAHFAYGRYWAPPPTGYVGMAAHKLPSLVLLGLAIACLALVRLFRHLREDRSLQQLAIIGYFLGIFGLWIFGLSVADKQAYRYAMPVLPGIYLLAALGYADLGTLLSGLRDRFSENGARLLRWSTICLLSLQCVLVLPWLEAPLLYFNSASGGLAAAVERRDYLSLGGQNAIVDFLQSEAIRLGRPINVGVHGDPQALSYSYSRRFNFSADSKNRLLKFATWAPNKRGEYVVAHTSFVQRSPKLARELEVRTPVYSWGRCSLPLVSVYLSRSPSADQALNYPAAILPYRTGQLKTLKDGEEAIVVIPGKSPRDYLFHNSFARLESGSYRVTVQLGLPDDVVLSPDLTPERYVARFEIGSRCEHLVQLSDIVGKGRIDVSFSCSLDSPAYLQLRAYWFGSIPLELRGLSIVSSTS